MNKLTTAVWEITMGCNMRCKHCGSSCAEALPDELNTSEALEVCDQLKDLGLKVITLSGGEPTTRSDWHIIAKRLVDNGIITSIITNGWLIDENFIHNAITSGIRSVCSIVVFGTPYVVDDSYDNAVSGNNADMFKDVITSMTGNVELASSVIPVKDYTLSNITINTLQAVITGLIIMVAVPILLIIIGIVVWAMRRKK